MVRAPRSCELSVAYAVAAVLSGLLMQPSLALAASDATTDSASLEEVVVTAEKRSENLQVVPISVTAVTAESLSASGVNATVQLPQLVSGLSDRVTYNQLEPTLRGVGTSAAGPGIENPVALYVDDVYYASQIATAFSLIDVSQVSVLKGPQGTLFGRNSTGGVIQVATRDPQQQAQGIVQTSYDNYRTSTSDLYVTGGLTNNLAASITGRYSSQGEGYGENITVDRQVHQVYRDADTRAKLLFTPGDDTIIKFSGDYSSRHDSMGPNFRQALPQYTTNQLPGWVPNNDPWDVQSQFVDDNHFISGGASLNVEQKLGWAQLVNIVGARSDHLTTQFDPSASPTPGNDIDIDEQTAQFTEELRLVSPDSSALKWQAGIFFFHGNGKDDPLGVHLRPALVGADILIDVKTFETTRSLAGYAQATQAITTDTNLTLGLRYTWERRTFGESQQEFVFGNNLGYLPPTGLPPSQTYEKPTWRVALDHKLTDDIFSYVSYNRGFKSGGYNPHAPTNPPFNPETLDAYEAGLKSQWFNNQLRVNGAAFFYNYTNVQVAKYTSTSLIYNGARARIYGFDLDAKARLARDLELTTGLEWLHARYTEFPNAPFSTPVLGGGAQLYLADATGKTLNNAPNATANVALDYLPPIPTGTLDLNVTASFSSRYYQEPDNFLYQPSYTLLNASLNWTVLRDRLSIKLFGSNLLNRAVATQINTLPVPPIGYDVDYASPPRLYGITLGYKF